jgi:class 3 adenylate cyclase
MNLAVGEKGPLDSAILFVDLVSSSQFASILTLEEYADYLETFREVCVSQTEFFFGHVHEGKYQRGKDYETTFLGDQMIIFLNSERPSNDVYQLVCLAITLKCAWLGSPMNAGRVASRMPTTDIACGIHSGAIWAKRREDGYDRWGFAINLAKRIETVSREGEHFQVFLSDAAYKRISRQLRNLLTGPRLALPLKGVVAPIGLYEIHESFVDPFKRLAPQFAEDFRQVARQALASNRFDEWIHSCLQVSEESKNGCVTSECLELCLETLKINSQNAVALYYAAQGLRERGQEEMAVLYLQDLTKAWPCFGDGWLELGRSQKRLGLQREARLSLLQARRCGVPEEEEEL